MNFNFISIPIRWIIWYLVSLNIICLGYPFQRIFVSHDSNIILSIKNKWSSSLCNRKENIPRNLLQMTNKELVPLESETKIYFYTCILPKVFCLPTYEHKSICSYIFGGKPVQINVMDDIHGDDICKILSIVLEEDKDDEDSGNDNVFNPSSPSLSIKSIQTNINTKWSVNSKNDNNNHQIKERISSLIKDIAYYPVENIVNGKIEMVEWIGLNQSIVSLPRMIIHKYNLYHRGIGLIVMNRFGQLFVHKRSPTKRLFPSMLDMFVGGVSSTLEEPIETLHREAYEELGLDLRNHTILFHNITVDYPPTNSKIVTECNTRLAWYYRRSQILSSNQMSEVYYIGDTDILTSYNHCRVSCYICLCSDKLKDSIHFSDGEIVSGEWIDVHDIETMMMDSMNKRVNFVPDGLQVWDALSTMIKL